MQQNWYAVYTKPRCEKEVSFSLSKRRIENFCPLNYKKSQSLFRRKILNEPLFKSYVFVKTTHSEVTMLSKKINGILSVLYWKDKPATINEDEIIAIKEFTNIHHEIRLEKLQINLKICDNFMDSVSYVMDNKVLKIRKNAIRMHLPSLGFTMVAGMEVENRMSKGIGFNDKELQVQSLDLLFN
ncbi:MAG TPA: transcription termination/antitermination NusG family protein [Hanamia sp.]|nr:transcription termination/antitermination NusG family protein [Hanamia sp.]